MPFDEARAALERDSVFTTHTPVPAGNEQYDRELVRRYLEEICQRIAIPTELALEYGDAGTGEGNFNLTALALRTSRFANGVSRLNAEVTSRMWSHLFPQAPEGVGVIVPITNGVHPQTWVGPEIAGLLRRALGRDWPAELLHPELWERIEGIPDAELWEAHTAQSERLGRFLRHRLREQFARHGASPDELRGVDELFQADALTLGFARRFATYKRASLIFSDLDRLEALLADVKRPVQILFAGKAHPADQPGQELIRKIFQMSQEPRFSGRVFFVEDYDIRVAGMLVQGVDVWLNTPRRPMEASGTSGMKAAMNGALNVSVLDGWWPEAYDGRNGWVIGNGDAAASEALQDAADADALYRTLAESVVPAYYDRDAQGLPRQWLARMKHALATITPQFSSTRMVADYARLAYLPGAGES